MANRKVSRSFDAALERGGGRLNWTIVRVPVDVREVWGTGGYLRVKGEINGFPFNTSLFPTSSGTHILIVNKRMQAGGGVSRGGSASIRIEPDTTERKLVMPPELQKELRQSKKLDAYVRGLTPSLRKEVFNRVREGKQEATRVRRAQRFADLLYQVMEAERGDLPPMLEAALARSTKAREGWNQLPPSHKRQHLFGIFYYRDPESRQRRIDKAIEAVLVYAERKGSSR